jgi:ZIP family zinc transporter
MESALLDVLSGSLLVLFATSAGALVVLAFRHVGRRAYAALLAFSAGVMAYSSVEMAAQAHSSLPGAALAASFIAGVALLIAMGRLLPHVHPSLKHGDAALPGRKAALVAGSITIHNVPEGLAVAAAFAGSPSLGWMVAGSIALQDVPEGLMISAPLACYGMKMNRAILFGLLSGVVEFLSAIAGFAFLAFAAPLVPYALAFSAGAMGCVVLFELLPDAFKDNHRYLAAASFAIGAAGAFAIASCCGE